MVGDCNINCCRLCWLYILDEPEAALSPVRQLAMISRINDLVHQRSQFIIATHSPIIIGYPNAIIIQITNKSSANKAWTCVCY